MKNLFFLLVCFELLSCSSAARFDISETTFKKPAPQPAPENLPSNPEVVSQPAASASPEPVPSLPPIDPLSEIIPVYSTTIISKKNGNKIECIEWRGVKRALLVALIPFDDDKIHVEHAEGKKCELPLATFNCEGFKYPAMYSDSTILYTQEGLDRVNLSPSDFKSKCEKNGGHMI